MGIALLASAALATLAFGGCELEFLCEDGACSSSAVAGAGVGGSTTCIELPTDPDTHGFPPAVYAVLSKNCYACHTDPPVNAPWPFLFYEQTQADYGGGQRWWAAMRDHAVLNKPASMPFQLPPIPDCEKEILSAWFATCGAYDEFDKCEKGRGSLQPTTSSSTSSGSSSTTASSSSSGP